MKKLLTILFLVLSLMSFHQVQGQVRVSGNVYEQDSITPIVGASVTFSGVEVSGDTVVYQFVTDTLGHYEDSIGYGAFRVWACSEGYECSYLLDSLLVECDSLQFEYDSLLVIFDSLTGLYDSIFMVYDSLTGLYDTIYFDSLCFNTDTLISGVDLVLYEILYPVRYVRALPYNDDLVRLSWSMSYEDGTKKGLPQRSFRYFELVRRRADETSASMVAYLIDTVFMDANWSNLPWGQYCWGVCCHYEGNRYASDTVWSVLLDKDMTTTLEVNVSTNVGLSASGAVVTLSSHNGQQYIYQAVADSVGYVLMPDVYRDLYDLQVQLDGYVDYVSSAPLSIMEPQHANVVLWEALYGIESLYVSNTGYAMWQLSDTLHRDLQYYELKLNGQAVGTTTETTFQFDVTGLSPGEVCLASVRPVFLSETCDWYPKNWVYWPCSHFPVAELQWSQGDDAVLLSWEDPEGTSVLGAYLYRDDEYLGFVEGNTYLDETVAMHGEVNYCIRLLYDGPLDGTYYSLSCESCVVASFPVFCDPPMKLEGENYWNSDIDYGAMISWGERPEPIYQWLHYDNGVYKRSLGGDNEPIIFWSIRFEAEELAAYFGCSLKKISLFDVGTGIYQLWIYIGGETSPRTLVWAQNMALCNAQDWHVESIEPALEIPENEPLWIVVGQQGLSRPAAACADQGNPNGRWVSLDGEHWTDMLTYNMHYTWMLRAYVTNRNGRLVELESDSHTLQCYNLYRSYDDIDYQQIAAIPAVEGQEFYQYRDVLVDESHDAFYYKLTALYLSDEGETCESDFAASLYNPDEQFVYVDDHWVTAEWTDTDLKLYPNPSNGVLTIECAGMKKLMVYNVLGQVLLDKETSGDAMQLDLTRFENGLYWLVAVSQNGVTKRPFVLAR